MAPAEVHVLRIPKGLKLVARYVVGLALAFKPSRGF